ncbi:MAG: DUF433 domain-containing protein [Bacteroidota bacterium]
MKSKEVYYINQNVLGGRPLFKGTLVPIKFLEDYLSEGKSVEEFLERFPSVKKEQAEFIEAVFNARKSAKYEKPLYEKFTFTGFIVVTGWSILFAFPIISVASDFDFLHSFDNLRPIEVFGLSYGAIWMLCFLFMCLIPKLRSMYIYRKNYHN